MSYYELFQQGPSVYIPILLLSLLITIVAYGAFPVIFAAVRKSPITPKKYRRFCYGINLIVMFLFVANNGGTSSGAPYLLWTWIFSSLGRTILSSKGALTDGKPVPTSTPVSSNTRITEIPEGGWRCSCGRGHPKYERTCVCGKTKTDNLNNIETEQTADNFAPNKQIAFCSKCGEKLIDNSRFCRKCGTEIVRE